MRLGILCCFFLLAISFDAPVRIGSPWPTSRVSNVSPAKNGNVLTITTNKNSKQEVIRIDITRL